MDQHHDEPIFKTFTDVKECIDFVVPFVLREHVVITRLVALVTNEGFVFSNMPIFKYSIEWDIENVDQITLNNLEFRDGEAVDYLRVTKLFGEVFGVGNAPYGTVKSISIEVTVKHPHRHCHEERGGDYAIRPLSL